MIRLILSDLAAQVRVWLGIFAVAIATGFVGAIAAGLIETGAKHGGRVLEGLASTSSAIILFTAVTALIVLGSTANLTVALHQRGYALWQLVGIRPVLVAVVVLVQLGLVGTVGALIGALAAIPAFAPLFSWVFRDWEQLQGITLHLGVVSVLAVAGGTAIVIVLGGLRGARRASHTPPIEALRDPEPPRVKMGWLRIVLTTATVVGTIALAANLDGTASLSAFSGQAILLTPLIAAAFAAAGPILFPFVLRAWTSSLPAKVSASWFLARNSARHRLSRSTAAVGPLMVATALAGGLYTTGATIAAAEAARTGNSTSFDLAPEGVVIILGGPLLLSAVAAASTVFMSGRSREREYALIQAAGSTHVTIVFTAVWEAVIYAATAAILGMLATIIGGFFVASALALPHPTIAVATIGMVAGGGFALILAASVGPTVAALRHEIPRTLALE